MANSITTLAADLEISFDHGCRFRAVDCIRGNFDTLASDLTIFTPASGFIWALVGILYSKAAAHQIIFTSGSTQLVSLDISSNGLAKGVGSGDGVLLTGLAAGDALKVQFTTAFASQVLFYVAQYKPLG